MDNGQLWSRFAAVYKRAVTVLLSLNGTRFNAARGLAPRIYEGGSPYSRQHSNFHVIPNQSSDWCGNPRRTADCIPIFMSFRTSSLSWCGNLPRHCDRILLTMEIATPVCALARNDRDFHGARGVRRLAPRTCEGGDTSAHTGIGGSSYNRTQIN